MTTYTKRRGRRSLAAILAALLMASVLAVVAGSPAQAANTSSEVLVDHDNDPATAMVREFGGRDRYATALALAEDFAEGKGGLGNIPTAFVASGYKLVDAVSVAGLAGYLDVPILLTPGDSLHGGVADFIENYGVDTIHILGGSGAVSDSVAEDIEALSNEPTVNRIEGADRYETAANAASQLGGGAAWCGGEDPAAILVNGGDVSLVYAMMVGPIAHRLQLPLLMTMADTLPAGTSDFIEAEDIEHVVIVGGTDSVSDEVATALSDSGVDTVQRIAGDSPAATSVELAGLLTGDCKDDLAPVAPATVALVSQDGLPDGVAAAPVLAGNSDFSGGNLIPMLVVGDTLPAAVIDYLAATPETHADGSKLNLSIVAIGGTAAVSKNVMDAALAEAASADALSVQIGNGGTNDGNDTTDDRTDVNKDTKKDANDAPQVGDDTITLYFSDIVIGDAAKLTNAIRDILEINDAPARIASVSRQTGEREACDPSRVTVTLSRDLKAKDTIAIVAGAKIGANDDQRAVAAASHTVTAMPPDRSRPTVSAVMIAGRQVAEVTVSAGDPDLSAAADLEVTMVTTTANQDVSVNDDGDLAFTQPLVRGDRVTIPTGAIVDAAGNKSLQRSFTAIAAQKNPRITGVQMSSVNHSAQAVAAVPSSLTNGTGTPPDADSTDNPDIWIAAKSDGAAAGAVGNAWSVIFDRASTYMPDKDLDIDVRVNSRDLTVFVRFNNGKAKFADLKAELEGNSAFDAMFEVKVDADPTSITDGACGKPANNELNITELARGDTASTASLAGGVTKVAIEVRFNAYVHTIGTEAGNADHDGLLEDILDQTRDRVKGKGTTVDGAATSATETDDEALTRVRAKLGLENPLVNTPDDDSDVDNYMFSAPGTTVRYEATTSDASVLPMVRDLVTTRAGADAIDDDGNTAVDESKDAVKAVAIGYAAAEDNDEKNAYSQVRIQRSSAVKAPK